MAITAALSLQVTATGMPAGQLALSLAAALAAGNGSVIQIALAAGNNAITVPALPAPTYIIIQLPSNNTSAVLLKGATAGDAGISLALTGFAVIPLNTAALPATINLNSTSAQTGKYTQITFL